jgi:hypothetical protein
MDVLLKNLQQEKIKNESEKLKQPTQKEIVDVEQEKVPKKIEKMNKYIECDIFDERIRVKLVDEPKRGAI